MEDEVNISELIHVVEFLEMLREAILRKCTLKLVR